MPDTPPVEVLVERIDRLTDEIKLLNEEQKRLRYALEGNGRPGIKMQLDRVERDVAALKYVGAAVVTIVPSLISFAPFLINFTKHFFQG